MVPYLRLQCKTLAMKNDRTFFTLFFEELKNIENRVAWFLAEVCKAEKGVQKDTSETSAGQSSLGGV